MTSIKKALLLKKDSSIIKLELPIDLDIDNIDINTINFKTKGNGSIQRFCDWKLQDFTISIYGWKEGNAGDENKTELPPPEDTDLYFGDILVIKNNGKKLLNMTLKDYNVFIDIANGGFEDLGSDDTESDNEINEYDLEDSFIDNRSQRNSYGGDTESSMSDRITDDESCNYSEYSDSDEDQDEYQNGVGGEDANQNQDNSNN